MQELAIGVVAKQAGIRPSALRYYESIGLLPAPKRINGRRSYDPTVVAMVKVIQLAQQAGFTVAEIQTLFHGFAAEATAGERWRALATHKLGEVDALIGRAQQMKSILATLLQCGCLQLEDCIADDGALCTDALTLGLAPEIKVPTLSSIRTGCEKEPQMGCVQSVPSSN